MSNGGKWTKGQSGNPKGRPPNKKSFTQAVLELLEAQEIDVYWTVNGKKKELKVNSNKNMATGLAAALIIEGMSGNPTAIKELIDRAEGKAIATNIIDAQVSGKFESCTTEEKREKLAGLLGKLIGK
jgi:hypothetical protein